MLTDGELDSSFFLYYHHFRHHATLCRPRFFALERRISARRTVQSLLMEYEWCTNFGTRIEARSRSRIYERMNLRPYTLSRKRRICCANLVWTISLSMQRSLTSVRSVRRFAVDVVGPKVREMDENERMDPEIIKACFEQGVRLHCLSQYAR